MAIFYLRLIELKCAEIEMKKGKHYLYRLNHSLRKWYITFCKENSAKFRIRCLKNGGDLAFNLIPIIIQLKFVDLLLEIPSQKSQKPKKNECRDNTKKAHPQRSLEAFGV